MGCGGCLQARRSPQDAPVWSGEAGQAGIGPGLGVQEHRRVAASFAAGCQLALRFGVGVVDPRAKRRFWD